MLAPLCRLSGILLSLFALTFLPPLYLSYRGQDLAFDAFLHTFIVCAIVGLILWLANYHRCEELNKRQGFVIVVSAWLLLSAVAMLPFVLTPTVITSHHIADAFFEAVSGLTTTGATIFPHLTEVPKSLLYYRQQLQFIGGMGIIVVAIAILPLLGVGGVQLFRAEITQTIKENKLTPRIAETAKVLWLIYLSLTISCIFAYWLFGMTLFDAIQFGFTTVSTGGFAPYDESLGIYPQSAIHIVAIIFMLLGSINFSLHFLCLQRRKFKFYLQNSEVMYYFVLASFATCLIFYQLHTHHLFAYFHEAFLNSAFHVVSLMSTTGFTTQDYTTWPHFIPYLLLILGLMGGCSGSTCGGFKIVRAVLLLKQSYREIKKLTHPNGQFLIKLNHKIIADSTLQTMSAFMALYLFLIIAFTLLLMSTDLDFHTAITSVMSCIANNGLGLGTTKQHFHDISTSAKWMLAIVMLVGRLEIFTVLILFTPTYWKN